MSELYERALERIFRQYVDIVEGNEGTDFLYEGEWVPEDWALLCKILPHLNASEV